MLLSWGRSRRATPAPRQSNEGRDEVKVHSFGSKSEFAALDQVRFRSIAEIGRASRHVQDVRRTDF